jgi:hypothetical protein
MQDMLIPVSFATTQARAGSVTCEASITCVTSELAVQVSLVKKAWLVCKRKYLAPPPPPPPVLG